MKPSKNRKQKHRKKAMGDRKIRSCFRALDRAADSRFLIIRLCRRSQELLSDSENLFFPKPVEEAKASKGAAKEATFEMGLC